MNYISKIFSKLKKITHPKNQSVKITFSDAIEYIKKISKDSNRFNLMIKQGEAWILLPNGVKLKYINKFNSTSSILIDTSKYEEKEISFVVNNLPANGVFLDIGCNVGIYSLAVAVNRKDVMVHIFEPVPDTLNDFCENLRENLVDDKKIVINQMAVGGQNGQVYITTDYHSSNYLTTKNSKQNKTSVPCITIDEYVENNHLTGIDIVKIDVEGYEMGVLIGAAQALRKFMPIVVVELVENPDPFYDRQVGNYQDTIGFLVDIGYEYYMIDEEQNFIHMKNIDVKNFHWSYHNYFFYPVGKTLNLVGLDG